MAVGRQHLRLKRLDSPLGSLSALAGDQGLCLLEFADPETVSSELEDLSIRMHATVTEADHELFPELEGQLAEYFAGRRTGFDLPLHITGSDFQLQVWRLLSTIPYGHTWSYRQQAWALGRPQAVRAVARANGMNRIAIIIPCHRVIGADGRLTGYAGGLWRKQALLDLERGQAALQV